MKPSHATTGLRTPRPPAAGTPGSTSLSASLEPAPRSERLGGPIVLLLVYLFLEYVRPANPLGIPLAISLILFLWWLNLKSKVWAPQIICMYLLVAAIASPSTCKYA